MTELHKPRHGTESNGYRHEGADLADNSNDDFDLDELLTEHEPSTRSGHLTLKGKPYAYRDAKEAMVIVLRELAEADPTLLGKCAADPDSYGRKRHYIAQSTSEMYPDRPDLWVHHEPLPGGWLVATNLNNDLKSRIIRLATRVAGLTFGRDVVIGF